MHVACVGLATSILLGCGGTGADDCDVRITINAATDDCAARAERAGCRTFEEDGRQCGLFGCVRCTGSEG